MEGDNRIMPTKTEAVKRFLNQKTHDDLAGLYNHDMECQVNVAQDTGECIAGDYKGKKWRGYTDSITTWKTFRIPYHANTSPEYTDLEIKFPLEEHVEAIGMTGWDWKAQASKWVAFDFDSIIGHKQGCTEKELEQIKTDISNIEWVTIRKSTSGRGLHAYVFLNNISTENHNEHAALGRSILGKMSALIGYDLSSKVDICGQNMWVWHRKMVDTDGLSLIKQGEVLYDIPPNWRDHIQVITGKRRRNLPQDIIEQSTEDVFEELAGQCLKVPLDKDHHKLIIYLKDNDALWWWDADRHMLVTHTIYLQEAKKDLALKGYFKTAATGKDKGNDHNCFLFPMRHGAWTVRRFSPGAQEDSSWSQDGAGWTRSYLNREPDLATICKAFGGLEDPSGGFIFREAEVATKAMEHLGIYPEVDVALNGREVKLKQHKDGRIIMEVDRQPHDLADKMQGWLAKGQKPWTKIYNNPTNVLSEPEINNYDDMVRHIVTVSHEDYGWMIKSDGNWHTEPLAHIRPALGSLGLSGKDITGILGSSIFRCWTKVNKPFQSEYPGDREWNRDAAQLRFTPTSNKEKLNYSTWLKLLNHCGSGLDEAIKSNGWCKANGILTGADYLKIWVASLFQEPTEPLPYLFFYGPQNSGKSIFHEALSLLLTKGYIRADAALTNTGGFNAEIEGGIICVVEETDLRKNKNAYNLIKDWCTARELLIHQKMRTPYHVKNTSHWIQCMPKDTWILTSEGSKQISDIINKPATVIVDGKSYKTDGFFETGIRDIYRVETTHGPILEATNDHLVKCKFDELEYWCEVGNLKSGTEICLNKHIDFEWGSDETFEDGYLLGWLLGDGTLFSRANGNIARLLYIYPDDFSCLPFLEKCFNTNDYSLTKRKDGAYVIGSSYLTELCNNYGLVDIKRITKEMQTASSDFQAGLISGFFDTDGTACVTNKTITLYQSNKSMLQKIQSLLLNFGINSHTYLVSKSKKLRIHKNKNDTISKDAYQLTVRNKENLKIFLNRIGFINQRKQNTLIEITKSWTRKDIKDSFTAEVKSVTYSRTEDVYDVTVPIVHAFDANGFMVHNCANDHMACPIFPGDTRITMAYIEPLDPIEQIPKKAIIPMLEKEAPDFLAEIMHLEVPPSNDRLNVPVISTGEKTIAQELNQTQLETFIRERCQHANGHKIKFSEFYDHFIEWIDATEAPRWSKKRVGREIPPEFVKARQEKDAQFFIGNIAWAGIEAEKLPKLIIRTKGKNDYLVSVDDD